MVLCCLPLPLPVTRGNLFDADPTTAVVHPPHPVHENPRQRPTAADIRTLDAPRGIPRASRPALQEVRATPFGSTSMYLGSLIPGHFSVHERTVLLQPMEENPQVDVSLLHTLAGCLFTFQLTPSSTGCPSFNQKYRRFLLSSPRLPSVFAPLLHNDSGDDPEYVIIFL
jgi:hypothetical protein